MPYHVLLVLLHNVNSLRQCLLQRRRVHPEAICPALDQVEVASDMLQAKSSISGPGTQPNTCKHAKRRPQTPAVKQHSLREHGIAVKNQ